MAADTTLACSQATTTLVRTIMELPRTCHRSAAAAIRGITDSRRHKTALLHHLAALAAHHSTSGITTRGPTTITLMDFTAGMPPMVGTAATAAAGNPKNYPWHGYFNCYAFCVRINDE
ncbi:hypothetical protein DL89DRAFT_45626 [Linderina pennispora]|uniref:Uncharacterized protein n=1 Tax=Linderina pennispora TaxID=61395 RepID=A0A1Y1W1T0_9FUNG|nr:uncharacterized protein DL89DRAFT_45626 [Linderina pennispora]ORX67503.1 hypothetical protein DL89DRAFT_45626 [Linderina pennispora]